MSSDRDPWVVRPRPDPRAHLRLFCFPFAGGGATTYRGWPAHLPPDIEVVAVQLPGREDRLREEPFTDVFELTPVVAQALAPYLDRPFALFGHSMGALVAFELARALERAGGPAPEHLFVSARSAPTVRYSLPSVGGMSDREVLGLLRRLGGTPPDALRDPDLMRLVLPRFRADLTLCERYLYSPDRKLSCPISALGGALDFFRRGELTGWAAETRAAFQLRMFPGGHFFIDEARARVLQVVAEALAAPAEAIPFLDRTPAAASIAVG